MKKTLRNILVCSTIMTLPYSCNVVGSHKHVDNNITFDSINISKSERLVSEIENPSCKLLISFAYPVKNETSQATEKLQQFFISKCFGEEYLAYDIKRVPSKYADNYITKYQLMKDDFLSEMKKDIPQRSVSNWYSFYEISGNTLIYNANGIVSFRIDSETFTGGAHPSHSVRNYSFSIPISKEIKEEDIFIDNYKRELSEILTSNLVKINELSEPIQLEDIGFFSAEDIKPNNNFLADSKGLVYTFNEYEIAAYALGKIDVFLPYDEIRHIMKNENPIRTLYSN